MSISPKVQSGIEIKYGRILHDLYMYTLKSHDLYYHLCPNVFAGLAFLINTVLMHTNNVLDMNKDLYTLRNAR